MTGAMFSALPPDLIDCLKLDNLQMSTTRLFGEAILKTGQGALTCKSDIQDTYKLIPAPIDEW